jgi:hypothetical protein
MTRRIKILAMIGTAILSSGAPSAYAQQQPFGTAVEARSMLERAVAAVKADKPKALEMFSKGEGGFKDRDLQPFCFNMADGTFTAATVPNLMGTDVRALKDKTGKEFGREIYNSAIEGQFAEVSYLFARPGADPKLYQKTSIITRIGDQGCGVGYFK